MAERPDQVSAFPELLADALRRDAGRPLVTFYDHASGERVELSVASYANWVAKTANLMDDEFDVERGDDLVVDLPTHWLGPVVLGAAWSLGARAASSSADPRLVVCGPAGVDTVRSAPVLAISLRPWGGRFADPLPPGVTDFAEVTLGQPDVFVADEPAEAGDPAYDDLTQGALIAAGSALMGDGGRLMTDLNPCSVAGAHTLPAALVASGGAVWVSHPDPERWAETAAAERATIQLRS